MREGAHGCFQVGLGPCRPSTRAELGWQQREPVLLQSHLMIDNVRLSSDSKVDWSINWLTHLPDCTHPAAAQNFSPFNVVAWHGNYAPYKYDLNKFCPGKCNGLKLWHC